MGKSLQDWGEEYQYFSGKASEATRTLALGGMAVIWIFHDDNPGSASPLDPVFIWPLIFLTLSLACDLMHYLSGAAIWYEFYIYHEKKTPKKKHDNIEAPIWKRKVISFFSTLKLL